MMADIVDTTIVKENSMMPRGNNQISPRIKSKNQMKASSRIKSTSRFIGWKLFGIEDSEKIKILNVSMMREQERFTCTGFKMKEQKF